MAERKIVRYPESGTLPAPQQTIQGYKEAFSGYPWFENLTVEDVQSRIEKDMKRPNFAGVWFVDSDNDLIGASWYYDTDVEKLRSERGEELALFAHKIMEEMNIGHIVWQSMTVVSPKYQNQGMGTELKRVVFDDLKNEANQTGPILYMTRIREDNLGSQGMNKDHLKPTGIKIAASKTHPSQPDGIMHQYWYTVINPQQNK